MPRYLVKPDVAFQYGLSHRECEILPWVAAGSTTEEIAIIFGISPVTVRSHIAALVRKLSANNRGHLSIHALELGVLAHED
jgi:DNA-binding CsgD family transcriptional regulator